MEDTPTPLPRYLERHYHRLDDIGTFIGTLVLCSLVPCLVWLVL